jgi:hypothetical protein
MRMTLPSKKNKELVLTAPAPVPVGHRTVGTKAGDSCASDAKANKEMAEKAKGKGPLNAGQQGIKKSGKK